MSTYSPPPKIFHSPTKWEGIDDHSWIFGFKFLLAFHCASGVGMVWGDAVYWVTHQPAISRLANAQHHRHQHQTSNFSCLLCIFHSFDQIWWRGQFLDLASFYIVFTRKLYIYVSWLWKQLWCLQAQWSLGKDLALKGLWWEANEITRNLHEMHKPKLLVCIYF